MTASTEPIQRKMRTAAVFSFIKKNAVMCIALLAAAVTAFIVPPDAKYADYFDVSMDYITCRCDEPQGKLYQVKPPVADNPELAKFVEMCFEPDSPMNEQLKQTLIQMLGTVKA